MDADAWSRDAWWMGDVLANESLLTQINHSDHQTMLRKHSLMERSVSRANYPFMGSRIFDNGLISRPVPIYCSIEHEE